MLPKEAQGHKLIQDVSTRWNSTLDMLSRLGEQTPALHACLSDPVLEKVKSNLVSKLYNFDEQVLVDDIVKVLQPFKTATISLSSEMQPTSAFVLPTLVRLQKALEVQPHDRNAIKKMKTEMSKNLLKRSNPQEKQICLISSLLHPKTKELAFVDSGDKEQAIKLAKEEMMEYIRNPTENRG